MITHFLRLFCGIGPVAGGPAVRFRTTVQEECALSKTDTGTAMGPATYPPTKTLAAGIWHDSERQWSSWPGGPPWPSLAAT
jgi:hypothetical protein